MNAEVLTCFCSAEARHHLRRSFHESESRVTPTGHRDHAHPLQGRGEGKPLNNGHRLTHRLSWKWKRSIRIMHNWKLQTDTDFLSSIKVSREHSRETVNGDRQTDRQTADEPTSTMTKTVAVNHRRLGNILMLVRLSKYNTKVEDMKRSILVQKSYSS